MQRNCMDVHEYGLLYGENAQKHVIRFMLIAEIMQISGIFLKNACNFSATVIQ